MHRETTYDRWMKDQHIPIAGGYGIARLTDLPRKPWPRLGCRGTFIKLEGMEGMTGMYVAEIPPGAALNPEKHLYEELFYILQGYGSTEVWTDGSDRRSYFEWQPGSLFVAPLNTQHRLFNGSGTEPVVFLGFTNAPLVLDIFHNPEFVFDCNYVFDERYDGRANYFEPKDRQFDDLERIWLWTANFVPDVRGAEVDVLESKGAGMRLTQCELGGRRDRGPHRRLASRRISEGAPPRGWRSTADRAWPGLHADVAAGGWHPSVRGGQRGQGGEGELAGRLGGQPAARLVPPALQHRLGARAPAGHALGDAPLRR